jgi:hypothetical protein
VTQGRESKNGKFGREGMACGGVFSRTQSRKPVEFLASRRRNNLSPPQVVIVMPHNARSLSAAKAPAILNERNRLGLDVFDR